MKIWLFLLFSFYSGLSFSQRNSQDISSVDLIYGYKTLHHSLFDEGLKRKNSTFSDFSWSSPLQFVGVGITLLGDSIDTRGKYFIGNAQIVTYLPHRIDVTDSLSVISKGFNAGLTFLGLDAFPKSKNFDLIFNLGFDAGRILLINSAIRQRNLYFSPKISIQPKVKIGPIALSIFAEYGYDLTKDKWRKTWFGKGNQNNLNAPSNKIGSISGVSWFIALGYVL